MGFTSFSFFFLPGSIYLFACLLAGSCLCSASLSCAELQRMRVSEVQEGFLDRRMGI